MKIEKIEETTNPSKIRLQLIETADILFESKDYLYFSINAIGKIKLGKPQAEMKLLGDSLSLFTKIYKHYNIIGIECIEEKYSIY